MTDLPNLFTTYLKVQGFKPVSIRSYRSDLNHFLGWLTLSIRDRNLSFSQDQFDLIKYYFRESYVTAYRQYLIDNNLPSSTINRRLSTIRALADFCLKQGLIASNPTSSLTNLETAKKLVIEPEQNEILDKFNSYLEAQNNSTNTIKNYLSDIREYVIYAKGRLNEKNMAKDFLQYLAIKGASKASLKRLESSLKKFYGWAVEEKYSWAKGEGRSLFSSLRSSPSALRPLFTLRPPLFSLRALPYFTYLNFLILIIFLAALGFGVYRQFIVQAPQNLAFPNAPVTPKRYLSFQGLLTHANETPITGATDVTFKLYDSAGTGVPPTGGNILWNSGTCSIDPDSSGIFSLILGTTSGDGYTCASSSEIASSVFSENNQVWLEITVISDTLSPRIQIATVAYALNSETLQGFPIASTTNATPEATMGATARTIPAINPAGNLVLAAASPALWSTSGTFSIKGQALSIVSEANGNITLAPNGSGVLNLTLSANTGNVINATDASLGTSGGKEANTLYYGSVANNNTNVNLLKLASGSSPTPKFTVDYAGNASMAGALNVVGTINGININSGTISNATWNGTAVSTTYGGTGQNWSGVAQGSIPYFNGPGAMTTLSPGTAGYVLMTQGASANPDWTLASGLGTNYWTLANGSLYPNYATADLFIGGTATTSANFAFINNLTGTPTASFSANLTLTGSVPVISTTNMRALTIGGATTGNIQLAAGSATPAFVLTSAGNVGIGTTNPVQKLHVEGQCITGDSLLYTSPSNSNAGQEVLSSLPADATHQALQAGKFEVERIPIKDVKEGTKVYSLNEETGIIEAQRINKLLYMGVKPVFKLITESGKEIRTTGNHPYLAQLTNNELNSRIQLRETGSLEESYGLSQGSLSPAYEFSETRTVWANTKKSAFADLVDSTSLLNGWPDNLADTLSQRNQFVKSSNNMGVDLPGVEPGELGLSDQPSKPAKPTPNLLSQSSLENATWSKVIYLQKGDSIAVSSFQLSTSNFQPYVVWDPANPPEADNGAGKIQIVWDKIKSIEYVGEEQVYDIEVEGTHNFIANGILAHNTYISGNVGIGTTSPAAKLEVAGTSWLRGAAGTTGLFVNSSGNVGIGTTAPAALLDVAGNATFSGTLALGPNAPAYAGTCDATAKGKQYFNGVTNIMYYCNGTSWIAMGTSSTLTGSGTANYIPKWNTATDLTNSILYDNGNVGIGTTSPLATLDIAGSASASGNLTFRGAGTAHLINLYDAGSLQIANSVGGGTATPAFVVTSAGQVGIGTTGPNANLEVYTAGSSTESRVTSGTYQLRLIQNYLGTAQILTGTAQPLTLGTNNTERMRISATGGVSVGTDTWSGTDPGIGNVTIQGNVGIGTTGPGQKLEVFGTTAFINDSNARLTLGEDTTFIGRAGGTNYHITGSALGDLAIRSTTGKNLLLGNGTTLGLAINAGNVGIGTTGPSRKLDVYYSGDLTNGIPVAIVQNAGASNGVVLELSSASGGDPSTNNKATNLLLNSPTSRFIQGWSGATKKFEIGQLGNGYFADKVGIGTSSPLSQLGVVGNLSVGLIYGAFNAPASGAIIEGNVGIGTTNPVQKLHVEGQCITGDSLLYTVPLRTSNIEPSREAGYSGQEVLSSKFEVLKIPIKDITSGTEVYSLNEETGQIEPHKINKLLDMGIKPVFKLKTEDGREIRTTANHPYFVKETYGEQNNNDVQLRTAESLARDNGVREEHLSAAYEFSETRTIWTNGSVKKSGGLDSSQYSRGEREISQDGVYPVSLSSEGQSLRSGSLSQTSSGVEVSDTGTNLSPASTSVSNSRNDFRSSGLSEKGNWKKVIDLQVGNEIAVANMPEGIVLSSKFEEKRSDSFGSVLEPRTSNFEPYVLWAKVTSIEYVGEEQVYDIEVEGTHNFIANGILAHNTYISGNVGIGTTAPGYKLEVGNSMAAASYYDTANSAYYLDPAAASSLNMAGYATAGASLAVGYSGVKPGFGNAAFSGSVGIGTTAPAAGYEMEIKASGTNNADLRLSAGGSGTLELNQVNASYGRLQASGDLVLQQTGGNVGIGTTNPGTNKLRVVASGNDAIYASSDSNAVVGISTSNSGLKGGSDTGYGLYVNLSGAGTAIASFFDANTEVVRIADGGGLAMGAAYVTTLPPTGGAIIAGNVGIGTSVPLTRLDVSGTASVSSNLTAGSSIRPSNTALSFDYKSNVNTWTTGMTLANTGYLGIGTASPASKLQVSGGNILVGGYGGGNDQGVVFSPNDAGAWSWLAHMGSVNGLVMGSGATIGTTPLFTILDGGNVGIGTTGPGYKLDVQGGDINTSGQFRKGGTALNINCTYVAGNGTSTWDQICAASNSRACVVGTNSAGGYDLCTSVSTTGRSANCCNLNNGFDIAEMFSASEPLEPGELVASDPNINESLVRTSVANQENVLGIISSAPGITLDGELPANTQFKNPLTLAGRVPVKVSGINGPIKRGDFLTTSPVPGRAMKAVGNVRTIGIALSEFDNNGDLGALGEITVFANLSWNKDSLSENKITAQQIVSNTIKATNGNWIIDEFGLATLNKIVFNTKTMASNFDNQSYLLAEKIIEVKDSLGKTIASIGEDGTIFGRKLIAEQKILSPIVETDEIKLKNDGLKITDKDGKVLTETNSSGQTTHFGDLLVQGNTTVSGQINADSLQINTDATVSGTLYADEIVTKHGTFGDLLARQITASTVSAQYITNIYQTTENRGQTTDAGKPMTENQTSVIGPQDQSSDLSFQSSSSSGALISPISSESALLLSQMPTWTLTDPSGNLNITSDVQILGRTSLADTSIAGQLMVDATVIIDNSGISSLPASTLYLQPSGWGSIDIMAGKVLVDLEGNIQSLGTIMAKEFAPLPESDLVFNLERPLQATDAAHLYEPSSSFGKLLVKGRNNETVASIDSSGRISADSLLISADYSATQSAIIAQINTNATSGIGLMPAGYTEFTIYNTKITNDTLIYVTPEGSTQNKVLYVSAKQAEDPSTNQKGFFKVAIDTAIDTNIKFNWWIIN